jgi:hypothetical protein
MSRPGKSKGGVDPIEFETAMFGEDPIHLSSPADFVEEVEKLKVLLKDSKADWEKRVTVWSVNFLGSRFHSLHFTSFSLRLV